jgi:hypothetical protein
MRSSAPQVVVVTNVTTDLTTPPLTRIVREFEGLVKQLWIFSQHNPHADFSQLEEQARQLSRECFASALQAAAQSHRPHIEEGWLPGQSQCECGQTPQYKGEQQRTVQTWVGTIRLERGYFHCRGCGKGRYPLDEALGIQAREHFSDGVQQGICLLGVQMPFEPASQALEMLTGISISPKEAERITEERGLALEESLQAEGQLLLTGEIGCGSASVQGADGVWAATLDAGKVRNYVIRKLIGLGVARCQGRGGVLR